jgi:hypothetical protein
MKLFFLGLACAAFVLAQPKVSECFKVHELLRADEEHYWATWTNTCPYTVDSVYVLVRFADGASRDLADGVWSLHFVEPGAHRTMRFSAPGKIADFVSVHEKKITADMSEAFGRPAKPAVSALEAAAVTVYREAIVKEGVVRPRTTAVSTAVSAVIGDAGEAPYQYQVAPAVATVASQTFASQTFDDAILKYVLADTVAQPAPVVRPPFIIGDPGVNVGEGSFKTDFPDPWQSVLSPQESAVSTAPRPAFVRFVSEDKPRFP